MKEKCGRIDKSIEQRRRKQRQVILRKRCDEQRKEKVALQQGMMTHIHSHVNEVKRDRQKKEAERRHVEIGRWNEISF